MKFAMLILGLGLLLAGAGCQAPRAASGNAAEGTGAGYEGDLGGVTYGHGESGLVDYRQVLSDPGPFD